MSQEYGQVFVAAVMGITPVRRASECSESVILEHSVSLSRIKWRSDETILGLGRNHFGRGLRAVFFVCLAVPDLTRSADIQLNGRVSLRRCAKAIALSHRKLFPSGPSMAKPSGDYTPLGGFVFLVRWLSNIADSSANTPAPARHRAQSRRAHDDQSWRLHVFRRPRGRPRVSCARYHQPWRRP